MQDKRPEVLAPAGDMERLDAALRFGADAVYLGGRLHNMRASTKSFDAQELSEACQKAHTQGVKVYFTCNTLLRNEEVPGLSGYLGEAADCGVDAFIVSDIGVLMQARKTAPAVAVHISTQAGVTNYLTARELFELGATRVVLARELLLEEIRGIRENTPPELEMECFVHGAICVSFSGRCLLSQYLTGRDANRGECAQPCRWSYYLSEEKRPGELFPICEEEGASYILNARDLCLIEHLDKLYAAGIRSFKIEGRAKSAYYTAVVTGAYRRAVDLLMRDPEHYRCPPELLEEVRRVSHRAYCEGFLFGPPEPGQCYRDGGYLRPWEVMAVVEGYDAERGRLLCIQRNKFSVGDVLELLTPDGELLLLTVSELYDAQGEAVISAPHPTMRCCIPYAHPVPQGSILRGRVKQK